MSCNNLAQRVRRALLCAIQQLCSSIIVVITQCIVYIEVDSPLVIDLELIQETNTSNRRIAVSAHVTVQTNTYVRDAIPNTCLIVTAEHIAEVEQNLLVQSPVLVCICLLVLRKNSAAPCTIELSTETKTWCEPLTYCYRETKIVSEPLEWALREIITLFLVTPESRTCNVCLYKPIAPERICCNTILLSSSCYILSHTAH